MLLPPTTSTLFPYTTLFRSNKDVRYEDFNLGRRTAIEAAVSPRAFGADATTGYVRLAGRSVGAEGARSEEHTSELQSLRHLVCRLLLEKKKNTKQNMIQQ